MDNRDKIASKIAKTLGMSIKSVHQIVGSPFDLAHKTIVSKTPRSIYIRKVGTFIAPSVREELRELRITNSINKKKAEENNSDPIHFN